MAPPAKPPFLTKVCTQKIKEPATLEAESFRDESFMVPRGSGLQPKEARFDTLLHHFGCLQLVICL